MTRPNSIRSPHELPLERAGYVRYQQKIAHTALELGRPRAARVALRWLQPGDFQHPFRAAELLAVLRDSTAGEAEIVSAALALVQLAPAR